MGPKDWFKEASVFDFEYGTIISSIEAKHKFS